MLLFRTMSSFSLNFSTHIFAHTRTDIFLFSSIIIQQEHFEIIA